MTRTVVCYGDSNTHGADAEGGPRLARVVRWPGVLRARLGDGYEVVEEGLNGRTTIWDDPVRPGRNGRDYLLPCLWSHAPVDVVVIMLGTNDLKVRLGLSAETIAASAGALVDLARSSLAGPGETPPRVLLVAPPPLGPLDPGMELAGFAGSHERSRALGRLYRLVAEESGAAFLDAGEHATLETADGVHLDPEGHRLLGSAIADAVLAILGRD